MTETPQPESPSDYLVPWELIASSRDLTFHIKQALLCELGEVICNEIGEYSSRLPPKIADFRKLSEQQFFNYYRVGPGSLRKLKSFLAQHGKRMEVRSNNPSPPSYASNDHWVFAANWFKRAALASFDGREKACFNGLHHLCLAAKQLATLLTTKNRMSDQVDDNKKA
ncbi:MAG: hypothetical protein EXS31_12200 [Pedosphaera sp.]|nr:hypothetical protein [Pedosphaera sp.]